MQTCLEPSLGPELLTSLRLNDLPGVCAPGLLPGLRRDDGLHGVDHAVLQLEGLHQVRVPHATPVRNLQDNYVMLIDNFFLFHLGGQNLHS